MFLVKVANDNTGTIFVELWFRGRKGPKTATVRLKDNRHSPNPRSEVDPSLWTWTGVPMRIPFGGLLSRPKQGTGKGFGVTNDMLVKMATSAWAKRTAAG